MDQLHLGSVIAQRRLDYNDPATGNRTVEVRLGSPIKSPDGDWCCPWQILGIGGEQVRAAYGIDAFQCLQLVMKMIGATLYDLSDGGSRLSWIEGAPGDFGFPSE